MKKIAKECENYVSKYGILHITKEKLQTGEILGI
jgi:hypothetical protein